MSKDKLLNALVGKTIESIERSGGSERAFPNDFENEQLEIKFTDGSVLYIIAEVHDEEIEYAYQKVADLYLDLVT